MRKLNGKSISHLLKKNNITIREAAEKIGIHSNNLSSILNGGQKYTNKTEQKVITYFQNTLKINPDILYENTSSEQLIRVRLCKQPANNEIPIIREDLITLEKTILLLYWMDKNFSEKDDYINQKLWDIYTIPYNNIDLYNWIHRRADFFDIKNKTTINGLKDEIKFLGNKKIQELFNDGFIDIGKDSGTTVINIAEKLGIKIIFISLHSSKLFSASTPFFDKNGNLQEPIIFINKNVCSSPEEILWNIAKELFYLLFRNSDFTPISDFKIEIENQECDGYKFSEELLFNQESFQNFLEKNKKNLTRYFPSKKLYNFDKSSENGWIYFICETKRKFRVSYKLIISRLFKLNFENINERITEEDFCKYFMEAIESYNQYFSKPAYPIINGEPCVKPFDYSIDNLRICLNCFKNNKDIDNEARTKYDEYESFIKQYLK